MLNSPGEDLEMNERNVLLRLKAQTIGTRPETGSSLPLTVVF